MEEKSSLESLFLLSLYPEEGPVFAISLRASPAEFPSRSLVSPSLGVQGYDLFFQITLNSLPVSFEIPQTM